MHQAKKSNFWCTGREPHVPKLANVTRNPCLMWPHYILYVIELHTQLLRSLSLLELGQGGTLYKGGGGVPPFLLIPKSTQSHFVGPESHCFTTLVWCLAYTVMTPFHDGLTRFVTPRRIANRRSMRRWAPMRKPPAKEAL